MKLNRFQVYSLTVALNRIPLQNVKRVGQLRACTEIHKALLAQNQEFTDDFEKLKKDQADMFAADRENPEINKKIEEAFVDVVADLDARAKEEIEFEPTLAQKGFVTTAWDMLVPLLFPTTTKADALAIADCFATEEAPSAE